MHTVPELVLQALVRIKEGCLEHGVKSGIINNLSGTIFLVQKIRKYGAPKTIGFFGAQKRGKSSLINQLLHCDLLPTSPIPMSSTVIKIKHDQSHKPGKFTIDVYDADGTMNSNQAVSLESARIMLKEYGSHKGCMSDTIDTIEVSSNFSESAILENGGILVDTPGAESAFDENYSDLRNQADTNKAVSILSSTHIVIFVEGADYMESQNSKRFFSENLSQMRPLNVVNKKDVYSLDSKYKLTDPVMIEEKKQFCLKETMLRTYGVGLEKVICVSSKEAEKAHQAEDAELLRNSNLPELEAWILKELKNLTPENGLVTCLRELEKSLAQIDDAVAKEIFTQAKRPFFVLLNTPSVNKSNLKKIVEDIYGRYS